MILRQRLLYLSNGLHTTSPCNVHDPVRLIVAVTTKYMKGQTIALILDEDTLHYWDIGNQPGEGKTS